MSDAPVACSARISATGQVTNIATNNLGKTRIRRVILIATGSAGSVVTRDGGAGGTVRIPQLDTPANAGQTDFVDFPEGIIFDTDVHATISNCAAIYVYG